MRFFDREIETAELRRIRDVSEKSSRFTVLTGRRRVGKTELIHHALGDRPYIYWYVTRSVERTLVATFQESAESVLGVRLPARAETISALFAWVMEESQRQHVTLVIDEFQEFMRIDQAIFSEMASIWDRLHKKARINLVVSGSINRLMNLIFFDAGEPLYGRNTGKIRLMPFRISVLKEILATHAPKGRYEPEDLLTLWTLTGGVARYVEQLMDEGAVTSKAMLECALRQSSPILDEGKVVLIQEFGKDYGTYFSILAAVACGRTSYGELKNELGVEPGAYLDKLERDYGILERKMPFKALPKGKNGQYKIEDRFFRFWFRFVYKYQYLVESGRYAELKAIVSRDFPTYSGESLESYFRALFLERESYTRTGGWWDRKGENEIDIVAEDELGKRLDFYEVKRDKRDISLSSLGMKAQSYLEKNGQPKSGWKVSHLGLSLGDM